MVVQEIRPSRAWYWVSAALVLGAAVCLALAVFGFFSLIRQVEGFQRVEVPGQREVSFTESGDYMLFVEGPGLSGRDGAGVRVVSLEPVDGGDPVQLSRPRVTTNYTLAGHEGRGLASFTIDRPGTYVLTVDQPTDPRATEVAVGRGIGRGILLPILLILGAVLVLMPAALVTGIVTLVRRRGSRRRQAARTPDASQLPYGRYWDGARWVEHRPSGSDPR